METNRLRQFCLIVETGSISKAAELSHVTHSGMSKAMSHLQDELKVALFQPSGRGITITHDGMRIYRNAKKFLETEKSLFFDHTNEPTEEYRIGSVEIFMGSLIRGFKQHRPVASSIKLIDVEPGVMEQQIVSGNLDIGITYLPFPATELKLIPLGKFKLGCFHRADVFPGYDFSDLPFAVPAKLLPENPLGIKERDGWHDSILPRKIAFRVNLLATAVQLCLDGQCAMHIPHFLAKELNQSQPAGQKLVEFSMPSGTPKATHTLYVMTHDRSVEDANIKKICAILRQGALKV